MLTFLEKVPCPPSPPPYTTPPAPREPKLKPGSLGRGSTATRRTTPIVTWFSDTQTTSALIGSSRTSRSALIILTRNTWCWTWPSCMLGYAAEVEGSDGDRLDEEDLVADDDTGICINFFGWKWFFVVVLNFRWSSCATRGSNRVRVGIVDWGKLSGQCPLSRVWWS